MKIHLLLVFFLLAVTKLYAQDNVPYAEKAAELQKSIWGTTEPEFQNTKVPDKYKNESAIILARSYSLQKATTGKFKFLLVTAGVVAHTYKVKTFHERVKINDKTALDQFSQLEYQKKLNNTLSLGFTKFTEVHNTYVGAKIIKPDGKEIIVNTSEEVLTQNETKNQKGKLAISGLQIGDIIDYYTSTIDVTERSNESSDDNKLILLADEYPMMYYHISFQYNKKNKIRYFSANDAPNLEENSNADGDLLLNLTTRDVPKLRTQLFTSLLRQYPYIAVVAATSNFMDSEARRQNNMALLEAAKSNFEGRFGEFSGFDEIESKTKDYFKSNKILKSTPKDSVMKVLYDEWKFSTFCTYSGKELDDFNSMNYREANSKVGAIIMSMVLTNMKIDHDVLVVSSRNSNSLDNVCNMDDFETLIRINGETPMYMFFDDVFTHFNEIPARFQGERAIVLHPKRNNALKYTFTEDPDITLPIISSDKNAIEEQIAVSLLPGNMQKLKIDRVAKETGSLRHDNQKLLLPVQDVDNGYMQLVNGETLEKRLSHVKATKKLTDDYLFNFNKEHDEMNKNFSSEVKNNFDQDPEQLTDFKIINAALENTNPVFKYSSSFVLNNMVKKAGNNYIIDAGKLTGGFLKLDEKDKIRDKDIYMISTRTLRYIIDITIPAGYEAKGLENFSQKKSNATGSYATTAKVNGNTLTITLDRVFNNNFEKVANWAALKDLIQSASDFNDQKILFEKKG